MNRSWPLVSLGELIRLERRPVQVLPEQQYQEIGIYCFGKGIFHKQPRSGLEVGDKNLYEIREGDLILQVTFAWEGAIALCSKAEDDLYGSTRYPTFRVNQERCFAPFLARYLLTPAGLEQINKICPGSAGRNRVLSIKRIHEIMVPLPPLPEQRRIVARIEELATKINEAHIIRLQTEDLRNSLLASACHTIARQYKEYMALLSKGIASVKNGISRRPSGTERGPIVLRLADLSGGTVNLSSPRRGNLSVEEIKQYRLEAEDLLFIRVNGSREIVGRCIPFRECGEPVCFNDHLIRVRIDKKILDPQYVAKMANSPLGRDHMEAVAITTAGQNTINHEMLRRLPLPIPPLEEQGRIVGQLDALQTQVDALKKLQSETSAELDALLPSILDKAFRGELI